MQAEKSPNTSDLNPSQQRAVDHTEGPLLVFAGAGSGKTRVLTRRIANLIQQHGVKPWQILAVTFTNKAAQEMRHRVTHLLGQACHQMWVSTFHSICLRILRIEAEKLSYKPGFVIYDTTDSLNIVKRILEKENFNGSKIEPRTFLHYIDKAKNEYLFPDNLLKQNSINEEFIKLISQVYQQYQDELKLANAMDFGDLICNTLTLFKLEPSILEKYQEKFRYLLIDEYQDTNRVQYQLIKILAQKYKNLCVVGDDDQSIYAFRGATVQNILNFRKDFPETQVVTLDINYRSSKTILDAANNIIAKNKVREKKSMKTNNPQGEKIFFYVGENEKEEAEYVVREILRLKQQNVKNSDVAVFYRTNFQSRAIEEALHSSAVPYQIYGGLKFYDRKEIKDVLAYLKLLINPDDGEALLRIINVPVRGIGKTTIENLVELAAKERKSYFQKLLEIVEAKKSPALSPGTIKKLSDFVELFKILQKEYQETNSLLTNPEEPKELKENLLRYLLEKIIMHTGYKTFLEKLPQDEADSKKGNLQELLSVAEDFSLKQLESDPSFEVGHFLDRASLASDLDKDEYAKAQASNSFDPQDNSQVRVSRDQTTISLMTLHLAKGLEFDYVFLLGFEEGILPHSRSIQSHAELEEERRLCYVGITRARKKLTITRASKRKTFIKKSFSSSFANIASPPSRFIADLPKDLLRIVNYD